MGTTRDAIRSGNPELAYVLCIEGYKYLLSDVTDAGAVAAAWAGTLWSDVLPGLQVRGEMEQRWRPFGNEPSVPALTFSIVGDNSADQFATDVFKTKSTNRSELRVSFDNGISTGGGFDIDVKDATLFQPNEPVFIGTKAYQVSGTTPTGNLIGIATDGEGYFSPFSGDTGASNRFPGPASVANATSVNTFDSNAPTWVSDSPTTWIGKTVGLWVHRVSNGVLDVKAEAELWFAGKISVVTDGDTATHLQCTGIQQDVIDSEVLRDQWVGRIKEGYVFEGDEEFKVTYIDQATPEQYDSAVFTTTGRQSADEFAALLAEHLDSDATIGIGSTPDLRWSAGRIDTEAGTRMQILATRNGSTAVRPAQIILSCSNSALLRFLGWENYAEQGDDGRANISGRWADDYKWSIISSNAPFKFPMLGLIGGSVAINVASIDLEDSDGTFFDQTDLLPSKFQPLIGTGETWGLFSLANSVLFLGRRDSATAISGVTFDLGLPSIGLTPDESMQGLRVGDGRSLSIKQCLFITGSFSDIISKLFASTDGNGVNHATYDVFPFGAGIPWDLLGPGFVQSLANIEQSGSEDAISIIVEKPTKLWDVIKSDFMLRMATTVWKDGGVQVVQLAVPNAATADHSLDETNKGDAERTNPKLTSEFQTHTLKIKYNRNPLKDEYKDEYIVRDLAGYQDHGSTGVTKTLKARNSYSGVSETGSSVESLGDLISHRFMPVLSKPLGIWTRSINHQLFHMAIADTVSLTDDRVRNDVSGKRGISVRACTVIGTTCSFGFSSGGGQSIHGRVELLYTEESRTFPTSPSMEHAQLITSGNFTNGYYAANDEILVHQNKFRISFNGSDSDSFEVSDAVRITGMDPSNPAAPSTTTDIIAAINVDAVAGYDGIQLTTGFTPTAGVTYLIDYDDYDQCTDAQKLHSFQAGDGDGVIMDTIEPNSLGDVTIPGSLAAADSTTLPSRYNSQQYGDGKPLSASFIREQSRMANNLVDYKTSPHMPIVGDAPGAPWPSASTDKAHLYTFLWPLGAPVPGSQQRYLKVAPQFASTTGAAATVTVTTSVTPPKVGPKSSIDATPVTSWGRTRRSSATFSTTSTTTYQVATAQSVALLPAYDEAGFTWITIEVDGFVDWAGAPEFWIGPRE